MVLAYSKWYTHYSDVMRLGGVVTLFHYVPLKSSLYWFNLMKRFYLKNKNKKQNPNAFQLLHWILLLLQLTPEADGVQRGCAGITCRGRSTHSLTGHWNFLFLKSCVGLFFKIKILIVIVNSGEASLCVGNITNEGSIILILFGVKRLFELNCLEFFLPMTPSTPTH